jgi:hypothetical protein
MKNRALAVSLIAVALVGCSSAPKTADTNTDTAPAATVKIPEWFMNAPRSDNAIFSTGSAVSRDLQLSQDMAILNAKAMLADRINSRVRSQTKLYTGQKGSGDSVTDRHEIERATKNTVSDVDVAGYVISKTETVQDRGLFRTYVLLEYSADQAASVIMDRIRTQNSSNMDLQDSRRAFEELDRDIRSIQ